MKVKWITEGLRQNTELLHQYDKIIKEQLGNKIIENVDNPSIQTGNQTHYLPDHTVVQEDKKTTKLRIVHDASARTNDPALNDCLYTGPKFGQKTMDIILQFRIHRTALAVDVEKAFLMISVSLQDRDVLGFLWVDDVHKKTPEIVVFRFTRVVLSVVSSSPFLLNATIKHHLERYKEFPGFVQTFLRSVYVDDVSFGAEDDNSTYELYLKSKNVLAEGGFNLRKFITNSADLHKRID